MYQNYVDESVINKAITKVVLWMVYGLGISALAVAGVYYSEGLRRTVYSSFLPIVIGEFITVFVLSRMINKMSSNTAKMLFTFYSFLSGLTMSVIMFFYDYKAVVLALTSTIVIFVVMSVFGLTTKEDLSKYRNLLFTALISLIVVSLINMFMHSYALYWVISYAAVIIFTALIGFDMQRIKVMMYQLAGGDEELVEKYSIIGALNLYLDFINLFLYLLRIFGRRD